MGFVSNNKIIQKSISHFGGILGRSLGNTFGNYLNKGTNLVRGISVSRSSTLTIWYEHPLEIIL